MQIQGLMSSRCNLLTIMILLKSPWIYLELPLSPGYASQSSCYVYSRVMLLAGHHFGTLTTWLYTVIFNFQFWKSSSTCIVFWKACQIQVLSYTFNHFSCCHISLLYLSQCHQVHDTLLYHCLIWLALWPSPPTVCV